MRPRLFAESSVREWYSAVFPLMHQWTFLEGYDRDSICVLFSGPISATVTAQSNYFGSGGRKNLLANLAQPYPH